MRIQLWWLAFGIWHLSIFHYPFLSFSHHPAIIRASIPAKGGFPAGFVRVVASEAGGVQAGGVPAAGQGKINIYEINQNHSTSVRHHDAYDAIRTVSAANLNVNRASFK